MSETNKSLRIRTTINDTNPSLYVNLDQTYNTFEILSLKLSQEDVYKLHSANYGVIVGRVLANGNFGVPNAKISIFIEGNFENEEISAIYPYTSTSSQNKNGVRYNLLPDEKVDDCHQVVGTFPNKTYVLDNDVLIEVFDKYYKYTTRTNNSGDYIIAGVPTGSQTLHMDLDLSDCGILSQRPRDFVYKGYTIEQFENANQFKKDTNLESLSQIFSQDQVVNVIPFWGNENQGETIGITRADINISFRFEPTCVFMGSVVADNSSNGISKKCVPTNQMGAMDELTTGEGTIEMIRYTPGGDIEEFQIKGTQLIDGNGVWCYQIPMNLDYMMTDEYGNMVPTDDPDKGIPTRTRVRFRISMHDMEKNTDNYFRAKVLVPHNPQNHYGKDTHEDYDYEFGSKTREDSFRDLLWNNVYTVKSYIPRFQKSKTSRDTQRFTGIKHCNYYGNNNPMPYNNIRIKLPLMFTILCALIKTYIRVVDFVNRMINAFGRVMGSISRFGLIGGVYRAEMGDRLKSVNYIVLADGLCPDLENWYFSPNTDGNYIDSNEYVLPNPSWKRTWNFLDQTFNSITGNSSVVDENSTDYQNGEENNSVCLTTKIDYLVACIEMALAQEYRVINFDFYNDWVNGVIYMPRWMRFVRPKMTFLFGLIKIKSKVRACMDNTSIFSQTRYYTQQCSLSYSYNRSTSGFTTIETDNGCSPNKPKKQECHKKGREIYPIFGGSKNSSINGNGGIVHENETMQKQYVYYLKPCEWIIGTGKKVNLFANDIVLLGSLLDCNLYGIPQAFKYLTSSSYIMPTNLALTNMDDEGYLYTNDKGTICSRQNKVPEVKQTGNSFSAESKYYSTSDSPLEFNEYDDTKPITEAAGIAWNYTGPGQGEASRNVNDSLYMPGGHFLGISCINSETNIKSCVNLERVCEIGSNLSQRREEVRRIDGSTEDLKYTYFVPTGLISNDEVNGGVFRSMFATMNLKRLLCTDKIDEKTGYYIYDFTYLRPNGFDGSLKSKVTDTPWNTKINAIDEINNFTDVSKDVNYDNEETANTYTRTLEETKGDYYQFRFGLKNLTNKIEQEKRFLSQNGSKVSLPQYENSFYFYFGLRDGATAFDEFLKQFFSTCDSSSVLKDRISITKVRDEKNKCNFTSNITIQGNGVYGVVKGYYEYVDLNGEKRKSEEVTILSNNGIFNKTFKNLSFGEYTFTFTDELGATTTERFIVGDNSVAGSFSTKNFEFRTSGMGSRQIVDKARALDCGYILLNNLNYFDSVYTPTERWNEIRDYLVIIASDKSYYGSRANVLPSSMIGTRVSADVLGDNGKMYVWKPDSSYDIYVTSMGGNGCNGYSYLTTVYVEGIDNYDLYLGSKLLPYSTELKDLSGKWWLEIGDDSENIKNWAKRYALFKRIDSSASTFTNKIIAIDSRNRIVDTVLFGEPEWNGLLYRQRIQPVSKDNVRYENDNIGFWELSDTSVIPTTLSDSAEPEYRNLFGEMAINGSAIISDKIADVNDAEFHEGSNGRNYFVARGINTNKLKDKHGCIAKLEDGRILYCVKDGENYYFEDYLPEEETAKVSIYPIFYYPVMYRPFYVNTSIALWSNKSYKEKIDSEGTTTYVIDYNSDRYKTALSIKNGLTYKREFEHIIFNEVENDVSTDKSDTSGLTEDYVYTNRNVDRVTLKTITNEGEEKDEKINNFSYDVKEKGPSTADTGYNSLVNPNPIVLTSISDSMSNDSADEILWRVRKIDDNNFYVSQFTNNTGDVSSSEKQYYLVNGVTSISGLKKPLIKEDDAYISININQSSDKLYLFKFTTYSDSHLNVVNTGKTGTYVNVPGNPVDVTITEGNVASFAYISSNVDNRVLRKTITGSDLDDVIRKLTDTGDTGECCLEPVLRYKWNGVDYPDTVDTAGCEIFINGLNTLHDDNKKIIFSGETGYAISNDFKENAYVVSIKKNLIGENGSTVLVKIYPEITEIIDYSGSGEDAYFIWSNGLSAITSDNVSYEGATLTSGYSTNYENLTFESEPDWCIVTKTSSDVTASIEPNSDTSSTRTAIINVKNGLTLVGTWTITQEKKPEEKYLWIISTGQTTASTTDITSAGTELSYDILTNYSQEELDEFTATKPTWVNTVKLTKSTLKLTFNVDQNPVASEQRSGNVEVGGLTVSLTQNTGESFKPNLKVNGSTTPENIGSAETSFTITTEPNDSSIEYTIYVGSTAITTTAGTYSYVYTCGENPETSERTFTVTCEGESVSITQSGKASFIPNLKVNGSTTPENIGSAVTAFTITTEPNVASQQYTIYVGSTAITTTAGTYTYVYNCGENPNTSPITFTIVASADTGDKQEVTITQNAKAYYTIENPKEIDGNSHSNLTITADTNMVGTFYVSADTTDWLSMPTISSDGKVITIANVNEYKSSSSDTRNANILVRYNTQEGAPLAVCTLRQSPIVILVPNLKVNGSSGSTTIGSGATSFAISTSPNTAYTGNYTIKVNNVNYVTTSGAYSGTYPCGANTGTTEKTFTATCENESVIVTQGAKAYFEWSDSSTAITEIVGSASTSCSESYTTNYTGLSTSASSWITVSLNNGTCTANYTANPDTTDRTGYIYIKKGSTVVGTYTITQQAKEEPKRYFILNISGSNVTIENKTSNEVELKLVVDTTVGYIENLYPLEQILSPGEVKHEDANGNTGNYITTAATTINVTLRVVDLNRGNCGCQLRYAGDILSGNLVNGVCEFSQPITVPAGTSDVTRNYSVGGLVLS